VKSGFKSTRPDHFFSTFIFKYFSHRVIGYVAQRSVKGSGLGAEKAGQLF
jgi:hypothetical protein